MKIVEIQFKFFCGASWADKEVMILAETKEQAFEEMFQVTNPIHLERSLKHGVMYPKDELLQIPQPTGIFQPSREYLLFKSDPERFIDINIKEITLPLIIEK